jgi:MoxR-like ATPase
MATEEKKNNKKVKNFQNAQLRLSKIEEQLNDAFLERSELIKNMMIAIVAGEHIFVGGPPGTGKTLLAQVFANACAGGSFYEFLMNKFAVPEQIFGPIKFSSLKKDEFERNFVGYAPEARVWFLDEIWKASIAILNTLLKVTQDREMRNGSKMVKLPLDMVIAASNEYPQDESLNALYDRFLIRFWVDYLADADNVKELWSNGGVIKPVTAKLEDGDLELLREQLGKVQFSKGNIQTLSEIKSAVEAESFVASDRTWMKCMKLVRASAVASGRSKIIGSDFSILSNVLWKEHKDRPKLHEIVGNAADPYGSRAEAIIDGIKLALAETPDISTLRNGTISKIDFINKLGPVNGMLASQSTAIQELEDDAQDNPAVQSASKKLEEAFTAVDTAMKEASRFRERR